MKNELPKKNLNKKKNVRKKVKLNEEEEKKNNIEEEKNFQVIQKKLDRVILLCNAFVKLGEVGFKLLV